MTTFESSDGTVLSYHRSGEGEPVVCLAGGPMQDSRYLGDLGGLSRHRALVVLDPRGTGGSATPEDPASYRCDRQVGDVEALRRSLGRDRMDLVAHSAGASLALLYAAAHPERVARLALVTPSPRAVALEVSDAGRREVAELRRDEEWFPEAFAAFERIWAGAPTDDDWQAIQPFLHGRWADRDQEDYARNQEAAAAFYADGAFDPSAVRKALGELDAPVLLVGGGYDVSLPPKQAAEFAALFPHGELVVQPGAGHYPWHDDPAALSATLSTFLS